MAGMAGREGAEVMAWEPENEEQYVEALHKAQLKTEEHKWNQAQGLKALADEAEAKSKKEAEENGNGDNKPKRKSWL